MTDVIYVEGYWRRARREQVVIVRPVVVQQPKQSRTEWAKDCIGWG